MNNAQRIKYGVVSLATLERDLRQWDSLYCAGRLHKPVLSLREHPAAAAAQAANLLAALRVALLLLPERFTTDVRGRQGWCAGEGEEKGVWGGGMDERWRTPLVLLLTESFTRRGWMLRAGVLGQ